MATATAPAPAAAVDRVTIAYGKDDSLRRSRTRALAQRIEGADTTELAAEELSSSELHGWVYTPSLFAEDRVLILDAGEALDDDTLQVLHAVASDEALTDTWIVVSLAKTRLGKAYKGLAQVSSDIGRRRGDAESHISDQLAAAGVRPGRGTVATLAQMLDGRIHLAEQIARTAASLGDELSADDAALLAGEGGDVKPWTLTDAIDAGRPDQAATAAMGMLRSGRHPLVVIAILAKHVDQRFALVAHREAGGRLDEAAAKQVANLSGYPARKAVGAARNVSLEQASAARRLVTQARADLTGGSALAGETIVVLLVCRLAAS